MPRNLLSLLISFVLAVSFASGADAAGSFRLKVKGVGGGGGGGTSSETYYFGPKTLVGFGGVSPTGRVGNATAPSTTSYYWDTTWQWAAPRNGGSTTYGSVRPTPLSGCEVMTVTDSVANVHTLNLCADATIAGDYTWRWRPGDSQSSSSGTNQLFKSFAASTFGEHLAMRRGTTLNTTADTGGYSGTTAFRFACAIGNCNIASFNGSNHRVIRPELGQTNTIGPFSFEGDGVGGTKFYGFTIDGEADPYTPTDYLLKAFSGARNMIFENLTIIGSTTDPWGGARPSGVQFCSDCGGQLINSTISYVRNGISTQHSIGTGADIAAGSVAPMPAGGELVISGNLLTNVGRDSLATLCPRYLRVENNTFTDQGTEIGVGSAITSPPYINPFDSARQAHSDKVQLNYKSSDTSVCAWQYYQGIIFRYNTFVRGNGFDQLTFWSPANGFPTPNDYAGGTLASNANIPTQAKTGAPDPTVAGGDSQGLYASNFDAWTAGNPKTNGGIARMYAATLDAPEIVGNMIASSFNAGISLPPIRNGTLAYNSVIGPRTSNGNLSNWSGYGNSGVILNSGTTITAGYEGTPTIIGNYGNLSSAFGTTTTPPTSQVVEVQQSQYGTVFNNASGKLSPRTATEFRLYYRPMPGSVLDLGGGQWAGAVCPDGSTNTGSCP